MIFFLENSINNMTNRQTIKENGEKHARSNEDAEHQPKCKKQKTFLCSTCYIYHPKVLFKKGQTCSRCSSQMCTIGFKKTHVCKKCKKTICNCCVPQLVEFLIQPLVYEHDNRECNEKNCPTACYEELIDNLPFQNISNNLYCSDCEDERSDSKSDDK